MKGTWQFMSAALLVYPSYKAHEYSDDLESMLHSMTFLFVRYSETLWPPVRTQIYIKEIFDDMDGDYFYRIGGHRKASELRSDGYIPSSLRFKGRDDLATRLSGVGTSARGRSASLRDTLSRLFFWPSSSTNEGASHRQQCWTNQTIFLAIQEK